MGMFESTSSLLGRTESEHQPYPVHPDIEENNMRIDIALDNVLKHEGGYQNNRKDAANKNSDGQWVGTNFGITPEAYEEYFDKTPSKRDMMQMTTQQARDIYQKNYIRPIVDNLGVEPSSPIFNQVVDIAVNHGYKGAVVLVQRAAGAKVDGKAGPATKKAIQEAPPRQLNNDLVDARQEEYKRINKSNPNTATFSNGWQARAESFRNAMEEPDGRSQPIAPPMAGEGAQRPGPIQGNSGGASMRQDPLRGGHPHPSSLRR